jgi:transcriptional regulator with XRE-family HTH domain
VVNKTIVEGLRPYALGEKLRTLRLRKSMGLVELGKHSGLSAAMLSKLERGNLFPRTPSGLSRSRASLLLVTQRTRICEVPFASLRRTSGHLG